MIPFLVMNLWLIPIIMMIWGSDFLPSSWMMFPYYTYQEVLLKTAIYISVLCLIYFFDIRRIFARNDRMAG